jgi:hypothetical protein
MLHSGNGRQQQAGGILVHGRPVGGQVEHLLPGAQQPGEVRDGRLETLRPRQVALVHEHTECNVISGWQENK